MTRRAALCAVLLLLGLLALAHVHQALAVEDLSSQTLPHTDGSGEARDRTRSAARVAAPALLADAVAVTPAGVFDRRVTRAPPSA